MDSSGFQVQSHTGPYRVHFVQDGPAHACSAASDQVHYIVDRRIGELYESRLKAVLAAPSVLLLDANEHTKSLEQFPTYVDHLVSRSFQRRHRLVAIGGGVIQDATCFLAATMMRGVDWSFYPTTLLAQADSCIGSKSSINVGEAKNILGTFTPPREIFIDVGFLSTLDERDVRSGVGEILKVHAIEGPQAFLRVAADYDRLFKEPAVMADYVRRALQIKKPFVEVDEYDRDRRQVFNYGHSFGHAIESASDFAVPHGIAVTMGMDLANFTSWRLGDAGRDVFDRMHPILLRNYRGFEGTDIPLEPFLAALRRDKKNVGNSAVTIVIPGADGRPQRVTKPMDRAFVDSCVAYFDAARAA